MDTVQIIDEALRLPEQERAALAQRLLRSLEATPADADWETAWSAEIEQRLRRVAAGSFVARDWNEAVRDARNSLHRKDAE